MEYHVHIILFVVLFVGDETKIKALQVTEIRWRFICFHCVVLLVHCRICFDKVNIVDKEMKTKGQSIQKRGKYYISSVNGFVVVVCCLDPKEKKNCDKKNAFSEWKK